MDPTAWLPACGIGGSIDNGMDGSMDSSMAVVMAISMDNIVVNSFPGKWVLARSKKKLARARAYGTRTDAT